MKIKRPKLNLKISNVYHINCHNQYSINMYKDIRYTRNESVKVKIWFAPNIIGTGFQFHYFDHESNTWHPFSYDQKIKFTFILMTQMKYNDILQSSSMHRKFKKEYLDKFVLKYLY